MKSRKLEIVPIKQLKRDPLYQRKVDRKRVELIKQNFDYDIVNPLIVNKRIGEEGYYIIDGQHTYYALSELGYNECECIVYYGLTQSEEALLFVKRNDPKTHKPVSDKEVFHAGLIGNDATSLRIKIAVEDMGYQLYARNQKGISCTKSLKMTFEDYGEEKFIAILELYNTIFKQYKLEELPFKALALFYGTFFEEMKQKEIRERFIEKFIDINPNTLSKEADNSYRKISKATVAQVMVDRYNARLRQESKLKDIITKGV